jgi:hypothetical protein
VTHWGRSLSSDLQGNEKIEPFKRTKNKPNDGKRIWALPQKISSIEWECKGDLNERRPSSIVLPLARLGRLQTFVKDMIGLTSHSVGGQSAELSTIIRGAYDTSGKRALSAVSACYPYLAERNSTVSTCTNLPPGFSTKGN